MPFTHHVAGQPGWARGHDGESDFIKQEGAARGFEVVDIRTNWKRYLEFSQSKPAAFLKDIVHLSPAGEALWAKFALPHFVYLPDAKPDWRGRVRVFTPNGKPFAATTSEYPTDGVSVTAPIKIAFAGRRVDLLSGAALSAKPGSAKILIDGKAPSSLPELYYASTSTRPPDFFWPMIRRAQLGGSPVIEDWKITFSHINDEGTDYQYDVAVTVTGPDGTGNAREKFVSKSGRLTLEPGSFTLTSLVTSVRKGEPYPDGTACKISVKANFLDQWQPAPASAASEDRATIAFGLIDGPHTLEIIPNNDGPLSLRAIVVHHPSER